MKAFLKIFWITLMIVITDSVALHSQVYVKRDTTMTFNINNTNGVPANYIWSVSPAIPGFVSKNSTSLTVKWTGNTTSMYTLTIQPTSVDGCDGNSKSLSVKLYDDTSSLPIKVGWDINSFTFCPIDTSTHDSIVVNGLIDITGYAGPYTITYKIDNDPTDTVNFNTGSPARITFKRVWNNMSETDYEYHYVRITRIEAGGITQIYDDADAPVITVTINPVPAINDIEFEPK